jgi:hypothetical protein
MLSYAAVLFIMIARKLCPCPAAVLAYYRERRLIFIPGMFFMEFTRAT